MAEEAQMSEWADYIRSNSLWLGGVGWDGSQESLPENP